MTTPRAPHSSHVLDLDNPKICVNCDRPLDWPCDANAAPRAPLQRYTPIETPDGDGIDMMRYIRGEWVSFYDHLAEVEAVKAADILARDQAREAAIRGLIARWRELEQAFRDDLANARSPEWSDHQNEIAEAILRSSASDWQRAAYELDALLTPPQGSDPR